jgi:AraC-like DNA-binding protein
MQAQFILPSERSNSVICSRVSSPTFYPHFHSYIEIYLFLSGGVEVLVNDQKRLLGAGEIAVILNYNTHSYRTTKAAEAICLFIPTDYCGNFLSMLSGHCLLSPYLNDPDTYRTVLRAMEGLLEGGNELSRQGLVLEILGAIYEHAVPQSKERIPMSYGSSADFLIYIGEHFRENLPISHVARAFGYNENYFSRLFRQTFGVSFVRYLTMVRLREAVLLMQSKKHTITEAAIESGFGSLRSFYRAFYEEFDCTPKEYMKRMNQS